MTALVRVADADEMDDLLALMREAEAEFRLFPLSEVKARAMLDRAFLKQGGMVGVIGSKGAIEAAVYMLIDQPMYSEAWNLTEIFNFVRPAFRKTTHAKDLIDKAKDWATQLGVPLLIGVLSNERTEAKIRLYRRRLGNPAGAFFVWNASGWAEGPAAEAAE
jgi:GNAT superfamily N-acetyltransferase